MEISSVEQNRTAPRIETRFRRATIPSAIMTMQVNDIRKRFQPENCKISRADPLGHCDQWFKPLRNANRLTKTSTSISASHLSLRVHTSALFQVLRARRTEPNAPSPGMR